MPRVFIMRGVCVRACVRVRVCRDGIATDMFTKRQFRKDDREICENTAADRPARREGGREGFSACSLSRAAA